MAACCSRSERALWIALACLAVAGCSSSGADAPADAGSDVDDVGVDSDVGPVDDTASDAAPDTPDPLYVPEGCNPLAAAWDCLLPYPSDHFLTDAPTPTGRRVAYTPQAVPTTTEGASIDLTLRDAADGFSWATPILAVFPEGLDPSSLTPVLGDFDRSMTALSPTLLLRADDGAPVAHVAELDPRAETDDRRALVLHPVAPLDENTRYIVAFHGLTRADGTPHPAPAGFAAVRDGAAPDHPLFGPLTARYHAGIFPVVEAFGVDTNDLQLAWDFTTGTREFVTRDMLAMRARALERFDASPPAVTITSSEDTPDSETIFRVIKGTIEVPLFLTDTTPEGVLARGEDGAPAIGGTAQADFLMIVPRSVAAAQTPARVLQFGHGFFGDRREVTGSFVHEFADQTGMVVIAVDWWGMSEPDRFPVAQRLADAPPSAAQFIDRVHQAMINQIAVPYALRGGLAQAAETHVDDRMVYDPEQVYFYGISQGHILGGTYLALAPDVDRGILSVGGAGLSGMMFRALPFAAFLYVIGRTLPDALDQQKWVAMSQTVFDRIDPVTYAPWVLRGGPEPSPTRRVLMHIGIGDTSVPNIAAHVHANALGLSSMSPAPRAIWGLPLAQAPFDGSAIVEFDYGIDPLPDLEADFPDSSNHVHEDVRRSTPGIEQVDRFLRPGGVIEQTCDGPCDPD